MARPKLISRIARRIRKLVRTYRLVVGCSKLFPFQPAGHHRAASRQASIRPLCPFTAYRLHINSNT